ncbi:MAG: PaaI family thioesterase [Solirubrobacterales bacterium]|nr:PaaI family thioesterase [Solirubrobacterales bacterium]
MSEPDPPPSFVPLDDPGSFLEMVGPVHLRAGDDGPTLGLRIQGRHLNAAGAAQGGLLATLADFTLGRAVREHHAQDDARAATVSLTVDFLGPVKPGAWVEARTQVERLGGTLAFADCSLRVDGREVVRARGVFAVLD